MSLHPSQKTVGAHSNQPKRGLGRLPIVPIVLAESSISLGPHILASSSSQYLSCTQCLMRAIMLTCCPTSIGEFVTPQ